ncbi:MAG TPA: hypothetical protein DCF96_13120 [Rhodobacteraceae bacterium]|nr:hypothetical protein [Paracoccaceae bacterium]
MSPAIQEAKKRSKPKFALFVVMICTDRPLNKKLKRILDQVQLLTDGGSKSGSNLMIFASMIASQMFIPRRHMRRYIWLFSNDGRKSNHTRGRQLHVFHTYSS